MKLNNLIIFAATFLLSAPSFAGGTEVAILADFPNSKLSFVKDTLKERIDLLLNAAPESDYATGMIYFASRNGVKEASAIRVLSPEGSTTMELYHRALEIGSLRAPIVISPIGGGSTAETCALAARFSDTAFVMVTTSDATQDRGERECFAPNLLFVAGLNGQLTDLAENQSYGGKIGLAVPYKSLEFPVEEGRTTKYSSKAMGMSMVAGKMAELLRVEPSLRGAALIRRFMELRTVVLPSLERKVRGARALVDVEY